MAESCRRHASAKDFCLERAQLRRTACCRGHCCRRKESMAVLTGLSVLAGSAPVWAIINADVSFGVCLVLSALAGFFVSIAGGWQWFHRCTCM